MIQAKIITFNPKRPSVYTPNSLKADRTTAFWCQITCIMNMD